MKERSEEKQPQEEKAKQHPQGHAPDISHEEKTEKKDSAEDVNSIPVDWDEKAELEKIAVKSTRRRKPGKIGDLEDKRQGPEENEEEGKAAVLPVPEREQASEYIEKVIAINRVTKVTKGGKKLSFSALVVVGDSKGKVGYSLEKAKEVSIAIRKALTVAKKNMILVPLRGATIPHEVIGVCGGAKVLLKPAGEGTGVIAAGPVRAVCDGAGIRNILSKCHRSNNPINVVKATMNGLSQLKTVKESN